MTCIDNSLFSLAILSALFDSILQQFIVNPYFIVDDYKQPCQLIYTEYFRIAILLVAQDIKSDVGDALQ